MYVILIVKMFINECMSVSVCVKETGRIKEGKEDGQGNKKLCQRSRSLRDVTSQ